MKYPKIQSLFKRDANGDFTDEWSIPEFPYLKDCQWEFTEKIDGMNIRICTDDLDNVEIKGRTDKVQLPKHVVEPLQALADTCDFVDVFEDGATLFGEAYGPKINNGECYGDEIRFILFDVYVNTFWLQREALEEVGKIFNLDLVPVIGHGTLDKAITLARNGFASAWGDFSAEGIVARIPMGLLTRRGHRIITKVKHKDFAKENKDEEVSIIPSYSGMHSAVPASGRYRFFR